jgi:simple sugar transport system ATP-binding protein
MVPRLALHGIRKQYPGTLANDDVSLTVMPGEIHALLGENGAGKSTLVKIVYGLVAPDAGSIEIDGAAVSIASPAEARAAGIGIVFQHFSLFESLTVAENIALGLPPGESRKGLADRIRQVSARYAMPVDPDVAVHDLSVGERQRVEIVRCLLQDPRILILDEPTSVLTPQAIEGLFETLRRLRAERRSVVFISHKLEEIRALCDRATVLRGGRVVGTVDVADVTAGDLARLMIGRDLPAMGSDHAGTPGAEALAVRGLTLPPDQPHGTTLKGLNLTARAGEILGIAGVAGNGQEELLAVLSGERPVNRADAVMLEGRPVGTLGAGERRRLGLGFVPGERLGRGAVPEMSLADNGFLTGHRRRPLEKKGLLSFRRIGLFADAIIAAYKVATRSRATPARALSGGNLQKFIVGREIMARPKALVVAYPTWGVDVAAVAAIHKALVTLRDSGAAVVVLSEDLDELLSLCDRLAVLYHGTLSEPMPVRGTTPESIGLLMAGAAAKPKETVDAA